MSLGRFAGLTTWWKSSIPALWCLESDHGYLTSIQFRTCCDVMSGRARLPQSATNTKVTRVLSQNRGKRQFQLVDFSDFVHKFRNRAKTQKMLLFRNRAYLRNRAIWKIDVLATFKPRSTTRFYHTIYTISGHFLTHKSTEKPWYFRWFGWIFKTFHSTMAPKIKNAETRWNHLQITLNLPCWFPRSSTLKRTESI